MPAVDAARFELDPQVYRGHREERTVPDTLDLAQRARLAVNGILSTVDPRVLHTMWFSIGLNTNPPWMRHGEPDVVNDTKTAEALPLMRLMSGSDQLLDLELAQRRELIGRLDTRDGLYWNRHDPRYPWQYSYNDASDAIYASRVRATDLSNVAADGQMIRTLLLWRSLAGSGRWDDLIAALVRGLDSIAVSNGEYSWFPDGGFGSPFNYPRTGWVTTREPEGETEGGEGTVVFYQAHQIYGLVKWYAVSGDAKALSLARRLVRFVMLPRFWGGMVDLDGPRQHLAHIAPGKPSPPGVAGAEMAHWYTHYHARAATVRAVLEYARLTRDERALEFCRRFHEHSQGYAIPRMGWMNHFPGAMDACEPCGLGDAVALGIRLSDAGLGDYWDDVDAVVRNQLAEQQLTRPDLLERAMEASPLLTAAQTPGPAERYHIGRDVIARVQGLWGALATPTCVPDPWIMQCCSGNATKGLYYAWEGALREQGDLATVNLLVNRAGRGLYVESSLPYEGKIRIHPRTTRRVALRVPWWVDRRELRVDVAGVRRDPEWVGAYLRVADLAPGAVVEVRFPVPLTTSTYTAFAGIPAKERTYRCTFRGSTLVEIGPREVPVGGYPTYLRDHLRAERAPFITASVFTPDRVHEDW